MLEKLGIVPHGFSHNNSSGWTQSAVRVIAPVFLRPQNTCTYC